jgi:hypothetical protein
MDSSRTVRHIAIIFVILSAAAGSARAAESGEKHVISAQHKRGELSRVQIALQVGGDLKLVDDKGKPSTLPMSVVANLAYDEAILALDPAGKPTRSVRYYDDVRAVIKIDKGGEKPALDSSRRLIVAERPAKEACQLYSPAEPLKREELDLIDVPGSSLVLDDLLPEAPVASGESWKITATTLAALLCLDAVSWCDSSGILGDIKDGVADIAVGGTLNGAAGGIATEIELKIKIKFDVNARRITQFAMLVKENRAIGHVGPGLDTVAKVIINLSPLQQSQTLTAAALQSVPSSLSPEKLALAYSPKGGQFRVQYDRRWYLTEDEPKLTVLRMVDRGELVAQCNISPLPKLEKAIPLAEFQRDVERTLGKNFGKFVAAGQTINEAGYAVFRVVVHGEVGGLPIEWIYYLVQDRAGHRVSLAFTLEQSLVDRFAATDRAMVAALALTDPPAPTAAPTTAAKPVETK